MLGGKKVTLQDLIDKGVFEIIYKGNKLDKVISKPFCCDLLSIAMSRAPKDSAWVTVMGNGNTLAVASLTEVSCVVLAEGSSLDEGSLNRAKAEDICVFSTDMPIFEAANIINGYLHD